MLGKSSFDDLTLKCFTSLSVCLLRNLKQTKMDDEDFI